MTFEELIEKLGEWPEGCTPDQFREYQRNVLIPYLADQEERIRVLESEAIIANDTIAKMDGLAEIQTRAVENLQARIERGRELAGKWDTEYTFHASISDRALIKKLVAELLAALDGELPSTATIVHAGPLKMKPIEPEPKKGGVDG